MEMTGFKDPGQEVTVTVDGTGIDVDVSYDIHKKAAVVEIPETDTACRIEISMDLVYRETDNNVLERCFDFLNQAEIEFILKDRLYSLIQSDRPVSVILSELQAMDLDKDLCGVLMEILTACPGK